MTLGVRHPVLRTIGEPAEDEGATPLGLRSQVQRPVTVATR